METFKFNVEMLKEDFDRLEKEYHDDIVEWFIDNFLDVEYTINSNGDLKRVCLLEACGWLNIWVCLNGSDLVEVEMYEASKEPKILKFTYEKARKVFDYLEDLMQETLICK